jgi:hypothetical protein
MDLALENGDFKKSANGHPVSIDGVAELLQRALIRLSVRKGSFPLDLNLGSNLYKLKTSYIEKGVLKSTILRDVKEALAPITQLSVLSIDTLSTNQGERLELTVTMNTSSNDILSLDFKV